MSKIISLSILIFFVVHIFAQTPIKDQPGQTYFDMLEKIIIEKTIPEKDLLAAKPLPLPKNFMDTIKKYDWVYLGGFFYTDKKYTNYNNLYKEYKLLRFDENGGQLDFSINGYQNYIILNLNLKKPPWRHLSIVEANNISYFLIETPDEKSYQKILSYKNGTFIYLINKSGKMNDQVVKFREYYTAVPKMFNWCIEE
jgi:hypothetical protein